MKHKELPCWGEFLFEFNNRFIHVPSFLNNVARYKSTNFWIWLIANNPYDSYIKLTYDHITKGP